MAKAARKIFEKQGLTFRLGTKVSSASINKSTATLILEDSKGSHEISADRVLVAVGRGPNTDNLGLGEAGIEQDKWTSGG